MRMSRRKSTTGKIFVRCCFGNGTKCPGDGSELPSYHCGKQSETGLCYWQKVRLSLSVAASCSAVSMKFYGTDPLPARMAGTEGGIIVTRLCASPRNNGLTCPDPFGRVTQRNPLCFATNTIILILASFSTIQPFCLPSFVRLKKSKL